MDEALARFGFPGERASLRETVELLATGTAGAVDDVMRVLWAESSGGPIDEAQIAAALAQVGGRSYATELAAWVHGTDDLPLRAAHPDLFRTSGAPRS